MVKERGPMPMTERQERIVRLKTGDLDFKVGQSCERIEQVAPRVFRIHRTASTILQVYVGPGDWVAYEHAAAKEGGDLTD